MGRCARTEEEIVEDLLANAHVVDDCLYCHLQPSTDRGNRDRCYIQVGGRQGVKWIASRFVAHMKKGPIPEGAWVLHTCDNPRCINPEHLFFGNAQDNTNDMISKGRKGSDPEVGIRRRFATAEIIYSLVKQGLDKHAIAARLGISTSTIWNYIGENGTYRETYVAVLAKYEHHVRVGLDEPRGPEDVSTPI